MLNFTYTIFLCLFYISVVHISHMFFLFESREDLLMGKILLADFCCNLTLVSLGGYLVHWCQQYLRTVATMVFNFILLRFCSSIKIIITKFFNRSSKYFTTFFTAAKFHFRLVFLTYYTFTCIKFNFCFTKFYSIHISNQILFSYYYSKIFLI